MSPTSAAAAAAAAAARGVWNTALTRHFPSCRLPIVAAPMAGVSGGLMAAEACRAGALGFLAAGQLQSIEQSMPAINKQVDIFRQNAPENAPLCIGFIGYALQDQAGWDCYKEVLIRHKPDVVQCFAPTIVRDPNNGTDTVVSLAHDIDAKFLAQVGNVQEAKVALEHKVDGIIAQGTEAGGHGLRRELGNAAIPLSSYIKSQMTTTDDIPVIAAGGIVNGRSVAAALCVCDGASIGTRLWASRESIGVPQFQQALLDAESCDDVVRTTVFDQFQNTWMPKPWPHPYHTLGALRNEVTAEWDDREQELAQQINKEQQDAGSGGSLIAAYRQALQVDHDPKRAAVLSGQGVGEIHAVEPTFDILMRIEEETKNVITDLTHTLPPP